MPYDILFLPILAGVIAQTIKFFISANGQKFNFKNILAYSGMPSGHAALIVSLAAIVGLEEGLSSTLFAISAILTIIVLRDAVGMRRYLGQHGKILNALVKDLENKNMLPEDVKKYPHLLERIGHTPAQVVAGSLIGFLVSLIGYWLQ